jgi:hypothetical protein
MNPMRLYASLVVPEVRDFELFAILDVVSDTAKQHDPSYYRRDIVGTVRERGSIWHDYLACFVGANTNPAVQAAIPAHMRAIVDEAIPYLRVNGLQVDHDFYGLGAWLNVEGDTVRLIVMERFNGMPEEYYRKVTERNQRVQDRIDRALSGNVTANDLRELSGLPRGPQFTHRIPADAIREMMTRSRWRESTRNSII